MINPSTSAGSPAKVSLDPFAESLLNNIRASGFPGWSALSIDRARAAIQQMKSLAGEPEAISRVEDLSIPGSSSTKISVRLYISESEVPVPVMVYMHGGGWTLGDHTGVDVLARILANRSKCAILSVNYRLAPEHKYPAALDDVDSALKWVKAKGPQWGVDPDRLAIGGDSSGANLAAAASLQWRDRGEPPLAFQLLVSPALDHNYHTDSYESFADGKSSLLSRADAVWFHDHYVTRSEELDLPYVSPLRAASFSGLPPTLLVCAELDPLLDEETEFARRLKQAGVPVDLKIYPGMFHGFWRAGGILPQASEAIDNAALRMREALQPS